jgi:pyruvate/2-oxoglutarate/acetoin dehydrogenase E1 component
VGRAGAALDSGRAAGEKGRHQHDGDRLCAPSCRTDWDAIAAAVKHTTASSSRTKISYVRIRRRDRRARASDLFEYLDAPVRRVGAMDVPVAYCPDLEEVILPGSADVLKAIQENAAVLT